MLQLTSQPLYFSLQRGVGTRLCWVCAMHNFQSNECIRLKFNCLTHNPKAARSEYLFDRIQFCYWNLIVEQWVAMFSEQNDLVDVRNIKKCFHLVRVLEISHLEII